MLRPPSPARAGTPALCRSRHLLGGVAVLALLSPEVRTLRAPQVAAPAPEGVYPTPVDPATP